MNIIKFIGLVAIFFYILCWFTNQPTPTLHWLGIALPWLSLVLTVIVVFLCKIDDSRFYSAWGYTYAVVTIFYVLAVSIMSGSVYHQLPHLAACVCFMAYFSLEAKNKREADH